MFVEDKMKLLNNFSPIARLNIWNYAELAIIATEYFGFFRKPTNSEQISVMVSGQLNYFLDLVHLFLNNVQSIPSTAFSPKKRTEYKRQPEDSW